jgi:hypothetical protein
MALHPSMPVGMTASEMQTYSINGMGNEGGDLTSDGTLSPLPAVLRHGLPAVAFLGFLSFFASLSLLLFLTWRIVTWRKQTREACNQVIILIMNLLVADLFQSIAFLLNVQWVAYNVLDVSSPTCWAQGFFVSVGNTSRFEDYMIQSLTHPR